MSAKDTVVDDVRAKTLSQWRSYWLIVSLLAAVCSTLAKETGIVTFALCLLMDSDVFRLLQLCRFLPVLQIAIFIFLFSMQTYLRSFYTIQLIRVLVFELHLVIFWVYVYNELNSVAILAVR